MGGHKILNSGCLRSAFHISKLFRKYDFMEYKLKKKNYKVVLLTKNKIHLILYKLKFYNTEMQHYSIQKFDHVYCFFILYHLNRFHIPHEI